MHDSVIAWVAEKVRQHGLAAAGLSVLEVGSRDVNGSVRPLFAGVASYTGVDMLDGPGVDVVADAHTLAERFPPESFDVVISTEMLEHDDRFWVSVETMGRLLRPGGHLVLTARGNGFMLHGYPDDYYRFMAHSFPVLFQLASCDALEVVEDTQAGHPGLFGLGRKRTAVSAG
jgi:SAM-dependent methyltransferase